MKKTIPELLHDYALLSPDKESVVIYDGEEHISISCDSLCKNSSRYADYLHFSGVRKGDLLLIIHPLSPELIYSLLGSVFLGGVPVLFGIPHLQRLKYSRENIRSLVCTFKINYILAGKNRVRDYPFLEEFESLGCRVLSSGEIENENIPPHPEVVLNATDIAVCQLTSGTTGPQKLCPYTHEMIINHTKNQAEAMNISNKDIVVNWTPLYHDMGLICNFFFSLINQIKCVLISPATFILRPSIWFEALSTFKGTITWAPNFIFSLCSEHITLDEKSGIDLSHVRMFINAAEPIWHKTANDFYRKFSSIGLKKSALAASYGLAENTGTVTLTIPKQELSVCSIPRQALNTKKIETYNPDEHSGYAGDRIGIVDLGKPLPWTEITIRGNTGTVLPEMRIGEIYCKSNTTISSYYKDEQVTKQKIKEQWLKTGDIGFLKDSRLFVIGRNDEVINIAGVKYFPADMESIINEVEGVRKGAIGVFGIYDEMIGTNRLIILAECYTEDKKILKRIQKDIKENIAKRFSISCHKSILLPKGTLRKTTSGKKKHFESRERYLKKEFEVYEIAL